MSESADSDNPFVNSGADNPGCCECNQLSAVQIVKSTFGTQSDGWRLDAGIPYPHADIVNPCEPNMFLNITDEPGTSDIDGFRKYKTLTQEFETCVVCIDDHVRQQGDSGVDRKSEPPWRVYCCMQWMHKFTITTVKGTEFVRIVRRMNQGVTGRVVTDIKSQAAIGRDVKLYSINQEDVACLPPSETFINILQRRWTVIY
jgi:hypothetical protein